MTIAFNPAYLLDGLGAIESDTAQVGFASADDADQAARKPAILTGKSADDAARLPLPADAGAPAPADQPGSERDRAARALRGPLAEGCRPTRTTRRANSRRALVASSSGWSAWAAWAATWPSGCDAAATRSSATTATPQDRDVDSLEELVDGAADPAGRLGDGPGRRPDVGHDRRARRAARRGRRRRRRRQHQLHRRPAARRRARRARDRLRRLRRLRRGLGADRGLRADGRRRRPRTSPRSSRSSTRSSPRATSGFVHAGAVGAGHFAKMVHNGIEYGMMQAYAEGWELLEAAGTSSRRPGGHQELAAGHGDPVLAARPAGPRARAGRRPLDSSAATPRTPARVAGPSRPPSTTRCRCR